MGERAGTEASSEAADTPVGRVVTTKTSRIWLDDASIIHVEGLPGTEQTRATACETLAMCWEVGGRRRHPTLVDIRRIKGIDREARTSYGTSTASMAVAMLVGSPLTRMLGNVFIGFAQPVFPVRLFTGEAEALAWLRTFAETEPAPHRGG